MTLPRRAAAEGLGTALLLAAVVGSGIMGERLSGGNEAVALLANAIATGCALVALIAGLGDISGAHLNPVVTMAMAARGQLRRQEVAPYLLAQVLGAVVGVMLAHLMFDLQVLQISEKARTSFGQWLSEAVATFGLLLVVLSGLRTRTRVMPFLVAAYITAAYWFTASTSFANPAVTLARSLTNTFAGISPNHVLPFIVAQALGGWAALAVDGYLSGMRNDEA
jgi:glycerol uptake facilitator-like aquaporin